MSQASIINEQPFIIVEGAIGVGKTTLAKRLAQTFGLQEVLEQPADNPFLDRFYQNPKRHALATQLHFLFQRSQQMQDLQEQQNDLFTAGFACDYLLAKDELFAKLNLAEDEFELYQAIYDKVTPPAPAADLVIYLQASVDVLQQRIQHRGIASELQIDRGYLEALNEAYSQFFLYYDASPLLIVNVSHIDLVNNEEDYQSFVDYIQSLGHGRHFYNPSIFA